MPRFPPGASGNPGGRPKADRAVRDAARAAALDAVLLLLGLARDHTATFTQRRRACLDICRLAYGRHGIVPPALELLAGLGPPPPAWPGAHPPPADRNSLDAASGAADAAGLRLARRLFVPPR